MTAWAKGESSPKFPLKRLFSVVSISIGELLMAINRLINNLMVDNVKASVDFYSRFFGFQMMMAVPAGTEDVVNVMSEDGEYAFAAVRNGEIELMFQSVESLKDEFPDVSYGQPDSRIILYMQVTGLEEFFETIKNEMEIVKGLHEAFYGMKEFYVRDMNGYLLGFAEKV
ncbi:MAG: glyoxalase [Denitrovibrio sp.]|mgnify:CR=1 FL=1|nr:MAG: glyoxalase [Denitrovibrio sp.]